MKNTPPFSFLKFANPHTTHCQASHADHSPKLDKKLYFSDALFALL